MDKGLVSIIVPVYNAEKWLNQAISSIQAQTYTNWEAVIVDDGSTDNSYKTLCKLAELDNRLKVLHKENGGLSDARNFGLEYASGEYIYFLDADDMMMPESLERLLNENADIVIGGFVYSTVTPKKVKRGIAEYMSSGRAIERSLYQCPPMNSACGKLFKRKIFFPDGPRFLKGRWYEDLEIHHRLFERAETIAYLPEKLYFYRENESSFINNFSESRLDVLKVTDEILEKYTGTALEGAARDRRFSAYFNILTLGLKNNVRQEIIDRCWSVVKEGRFNALKDPKVRIKNKIGAAVSYLGLNFIRIISRFY